VIVEHGVLSALRDSPDFIPADRLVVWFAGFYRDEPVFGDIFPRAKTTVRKKHGRKKSKKRA